MATRAVTLGVGSLAPAMVAEPGTEPLVADLGLAHPSMHGLLRVRLELDDDVVVAADPLIGSMHRGAEKLLEVRDYRQGLALVNRHDWHGAFSSELGLALVLERMLGIDVPERATWARTLLSELTRATSHLAFLGTFPGIPAGLGLGHAQREALLAVVEEATGARMHTTAVQVGGLKQDLPAGWLDRVRQATDRVRRDLAGFDAAVAGTELAAVARGVGVLAREDALASGTSGPVARASGLDLDLRRDDPYCAYAELRERGVLRVAGRAEGDALARLEVLLEQLHVALDLVDACADTLEDLAPGPIHVRLPKVLRAPEGSTYAATENPSGVNGYLLVSRGERTPWRLKIRSGSFSNVAALSAALPGTRLADVPVVLASFFYVVGDIDR